MFSWSESEKIWFPKFPLCEATWKFQFTQNEQRWLTTCVGLDNIEGSLLVKYNLIWPSENINSDAGFPFLNISVQGNWYFSRYNHGSDNFLKKLLLSPGVTNKVSKVFLKKDNICALVQVHDWWNASEVNCIMQINRSQGPLLITWFNLNPSRDK